jgi:regulator of protease activity HflC (stomatin/prohibitin superfamily)
MTQTAPQTRAEQLRQAEAEALAAAIAAEELADATPDSATLAERARAAHETWSKALDNYSDFLGYE